MNSPDIGEQAISKAAEVGLKSQLDQADKLDVDIRTNPLDLMQGNLESVSVEGEGLVMKKELKADKLRIETNSISINPIKAALGNIELNSPTDARMLVVLKEEDIQRAFNSQYVKDKLQNLEISCAGKTVKVRVDQVKFTLPQTAKVNLEADVELLAEQQTEKISFTAIPEIDSAGNKVNLTAIEYEQEAEYNQNIAKAIIESAEEILDLRNFELDEMSLQVRKLDVQAGKLTIEADAVIKNFPNS
jgi:LmeA-like phospholipid-binding